VRQPSILALFYSRPMRPEINASQLAVAHSIMQWLHHDGRASPTSPMLEDNQKALLATADKLRANMDAAECEHCFLGSCSLRG
jgi:hypothetical protein